MLLEAYQAARIKTSVLMNGLLVPINICPTNLARFCRPVLFHNDHPLFDLSISGSSFLIRYRAHNLVLCTHHQLGHEDSRRAPDDVVIAITEPDGSGVALTSNEATQVRAQADTDDNVEDLLVLEYHSQRHGRDLSSLFFEMDLQAIGDLDTTSPQSVVAIFAIGYQTSSTDYEPVYDEEAGLLGTKIVSRWSKLYLKPTTVGPWVPPLRIGLEVHDSQVAATSGSPGYDPDGFSGSPVMIIYKDEASQHHLGFAGIVTHADKFGRFAVYRTAHIKEVVQKMIEST